jgi:hypothetical protein
MPPFTHPLSLPNSRSQVLSRTTNFANLLFTSAIPTHTQKKRGAARITSFKTSHYFAFLPVCCVIDDLANRAAGPSTGPNGPRTGGAPATGGGSRARLFFAQASCYIPGGTETGLWAPSPQGHSVSCSCSCCFVFSCRGRG